MKKTIILACALGAAVLGACSGQQRGGSMGALNSKCPIVPEDKVDGTVWTPYKDGRVVFCCKGCIHDWNRLSDEEKEERLRAAR
ncbi:MAG TPA: hypothetical protein VD971_10975 [Phycisphaerales bacterium]|nr:hypothetical protein [Phycisphaerales bacterium]